MPGYDSETWANSRRLAAAGVAWERCVANPCARAKSPISSVRLLRRCSSHNIWRVGEWSGGPPHFSTNKPNNCSSLAKRGRGTIERSEMGRELRGVAPPSSPSATLPPLTGGEPLGGEGGFSLQRFEWEPRIKCGASFGCGGGRGHKIRKTTSEGLSRRNKRLSASGRDSGEQSAPSPSPLPRFRGRGRVTWNTLGGIAMNGAAIEVTA